MTHELLRYLREQRGLTREQLADYLGDCTASTVNKWERDINPVPAWVADKMLRGIPIKLPVHEMLALLTEARVTGQSAESILGDAIRLWLEKTRPRMENPSQSGADLVKPRAWTPETQPVQTAVFTQPSRAPAPPQAIANIVKLPAQHVVGLNDVPSDEPLPETEAADLSKYPSPRRRKHRP